MLRKKKVTFQSLNIESLSVLLDDTKDKIASIFQGFVTNCHDNINYFDSVAGKKLNDYISFWEFLEENYGEEAKVDVLVVYRSTAESFCDDFCPKFLFISQIVIYFADSPILHQSLNISELLTKYSELIAGVSHELSDKWKLKNRIYKRGCYSLNQLMHRDPIYIHGVCNWIGNSKLGGPCINFQGYLRWPKTNVHPADLKMIAETIISMSIRKKTEQEKVLKAVVYQAIRLKGVNESGLKEAITKLNQEDFYERGAILVFSSIMPSEVHKCIEHFDDICILLTNQVASSPALAIINNFLGTSIQINETKDIMKIVEPLLKNFCKINKISFSYKAIKMMNDILTKFFFIDESFMIKSLRKFFQQAEFNCDALKVIVDFLKKSNIALSLLFEGTCDEAALNLVDHALSSFVHRNFEVTLELILVCISTTGCKIPDRKTEILSFLLIFNPDKEIRLYGIDILELTSTEAKNSLLQSVDLRSLIILDAERYAAFTSIFNLITHNYPGFAAEIIEYCIKLTSRCPYLMDILISLCVPQNINCFPFDTHELFIKLFECGRIDALQYVHIDYLSDFISYLDPEIYNEQTIPAIINLTRCAYFKYPELKSSHIEAECDFLSQFIDMNQDQANLLSSLSRAFVYIAKQLTENKTIKTFPEYISYSYQMFLAAVYKDNPEEHSSLIDAILHLYLTVKKFDPESATITDILELPTTIDYISWTRFLSKKFIHFPNTVDKTFNQLYYVIPDVIANFTLKMEKYPHKAFPIFCYLISERQNSKLFNEYLQRTFDTDEWVYEVNDDILDLATSFYNHSTQNDDINLRVCKVVLDWFDVRHFEQIANFTLQISNSLLVSSPSVDKLWKRLMNTIELTYKLFDFLFEKQIDFYILEHVYQLCNFKDEIISRCNELIFLPLTGENIINHLSYYKIAIKSKKWHPSTIFATALFVQFEGALCYFEALRFIASILNNSSIPDQKMKILINIISFLKLEDVNGFTEQLYSLLENVESSKILHSVCRIFMATAYRYPSQIDISHFLKSIAQDKTRFDSILSHIFKILTGDLLACETIPLQLLRSFVKIGYVSVTQLGLTELSLNYSRFLLELSKLKYDIPNYSQLLYFDDLFYEFITFDLDSYEKVTDQIVLFWLGSKQVSPLIVESMKKALVFGDKSIFNKLTALLDQLFEQQSDFDAQELYTFVLNSNEIDTKMKLNMLSFLKDRNNDLKLIQGETVPIYRKPFEEIVQLYEG